jgi:hypothetical protein
MKIKKSILGLIFIILLNGCAQSTALLGPAYTLAKSGNIYQAGLSYGSNEAVVKFTGKSAGENIQEILKPKEKDTDFEKLVKKRIVETRKKLNFTN